MSTWHSFNKLFYQNPFIQSFVTRITDTFRAKYLYSEMSTDSKFPFTSRFRIITFLSLSFIKLWRHTYSGFFQSKNIQIYYKKAIFNLLKLNQEKSCVLGAGHEQFENMGHFKRQSQVIHWYFHIWVLMTKYEPPESHY